MADRTESRTDETLVGADLPAGPTMVASADPTQSWGAKATLADAEASSPVARPSHDRRQLGRGTAIGRYLILSTLGAGAMGVVYAAYDPELDRKVAVKLLRADGVGTVASHGRTRLLREAQALAKLAHPNVVAIHDVGTHGDEVFLAMEFVDGQPLGDWAKQGSKSWREKLDAIVEAGRGVAAAHAANLLHRDLKPDNIMVARDGRVRVMDLGLARAQLAAAPEDRAGLDDAAETRLGALAVHVTQAGAIMGTPAYMAPEQFHGVEVGTAADQFALCVTAWELLAGQRPFTGDTLLELAANVLAGQRSSAPRGTDVPRWVWPVLERGLATDPSQRWPSVDALLDALERGQVRARGRQVLAGVALVSVAAVSVFGWRELDERQRIGACEAAGQSIFTESWNDTTKQTLRDGLLATGVPSASIVAEKTLPWLDEHAAVWAEARTEACVDAEVHGTWSAELLDRATWCLDERRLGFEALVAELSAADEQSVYKATSAAAQLRDLGPCRDQDRLARLPAPPTDRAGALEVRTALARARALSAIGKYEDGLAVAEPALARARTLAWPPLIADAGFEVGDLLDFVGRYEEAELTLADAYFEAVKSGTTDTAAEAATALVFEVGYRRAEPERGKAWARHADAALVVLGEPADGLRRSRLLDNLSSVHDASGAYDQAKALGEHALAIREAALGPDHPGVAASLNNLASIHYATGAYAEATALHQRALAIREAALGPDHPDVAQSLTNLAGVRYTTGAYDEAKALGERAIAIQEVALGPDHPRVALSLNNLATFQQALGANDEAKALHQRALAIREAALGPDHPDVAESLYNLAFFSQATGMHDEAKALDERALAIYEAARGPDHPDLAYPLTDLAKIALAQGRPVDALSLAERAVRIRVDGDAGSGEIAESRFVLARALWDAPTEAGQDRARAVELATQAREAVADAGEIEAWLTAHPRTP